MSEEIKKAAETQNGENQPKSWKDIAEVRMVLYVIPLAIVFGLLAFILSR